MKSLIVEDDFVTRKVLLKTLVQKGEADVAVSGQEALDALISSLRAGVRYDLICLDVMLPDMSGLDVLKQFRIAEAESGIHGLQGTKVIVTTALEDSATVLSAFKAGCEAYLTKPFTRAELLSKIDELVG